MMRWQNVGVMIAALAVSACGPPDDDNRKSLHNDSDGGDVGPAGDAGSKGDGDAGDAGSKGDGDAGDAGSNGDGDAGDAGDFPVFDSIQGAVIDSEGKPLAGVLAVLNHVFKLAQQTDAEGKFSFDKVDPPYDLTLKLPSGDIVELRGLTRLDPRVALFDNNEGLSRAALAGTITGAQEPFPALESILISTTGSDHESFELPAPGAFSGDVSWFGPASRSVDVVAAHVIPRSDGTFVYRAAGLQKDVAMTHEGTTSGLQIALSPAPIGTFQTRFSVDYGAYASMKTSGVLSFNLHGARFGRADDFGSGTQLPDDSDVELPLEGGRIQATGVDADGTFAMHVVTVTAAGTTAVSFPKTQVLKLLAPAEGASDVSRLPTLSWTPVPFAKGYWVEIEEQSSNDPHQRHQFYLPSNVSSLALADSGWDEMKLLGATSYSWSVTAATSDGFLEADDVADGRGMGFVRILAMDNLTGFRVDGRSFTTAP